MIVIINLVPNQNCSCVFKYTVKTEDDPTCVSTSREETVTCPTNVALINTAPSARAHHPLVKTSK